MAFPISLPRLWRRKLVLAIAEVILQLCGLHDVSFFPLYSLMEGTVMEKVRDRGTRDPVLKSSGFQSTFTVCEGTVGHKIQEQLTLR